MDSIFAYGSDSDHDSTISNPSTTTPIVQSSSPLIPKKKKEEEKPQLFQPKNLKVKRKRKRSKKKVLNALGIELADLVEGKRIYLDDSEEEKHFEIEDKSKEKGFEASSYSLNHVREHQPWIKEPYESSLKEARPSKRLILNKMNQNPTKTAISTTIQDKTSTPIQSSSTSSNADFVEILRRHQKEDSDDEFETDLNLYDQKKEVETISVKKEQPPKVTQEVPKQPIPQKLDTSSLPPEVRAALAANKVHSVRAGEVSEKEARRSQAERHRQSIFEKEKAQLENNLNKSKYAHANNVVMRMARQANQE